MSHNCLFNIDHESLYALRRRFYLRPAGPRSRRIVLVHGLAGRAACAGHGSGQRRRRLLVPGLPAGAYRRPGRAGTSGHAIEISGTTTGFLYI